MQIQSHGDLRHAIMNVQFRLNNDATKDSRKRGILPTGRRRRRQQEEPIKVGGSSQRDTKLSTFHALGKLLYAKRGGCIHVSGTASNDDHKTEGECFHGRSWNTDRRPPLEFDSRHHISPATVTIHLYPPLRRTRSEDHCYK